MRIIIFGKSPPIVGGTSTQTWWTCRVLSEMGHDVLLLSAADYAFSGHRAMQMDGDSAWYREPVGARGSLKITHVGPLNIGLSHHTLATQLIAEGHSWISAHGRPDVVMGWYLEPYGMAALALSRYLDVPLILRTAGSDLQRLTQVRGLGIALKAALDQASVILTSSGQDEVLHAIGVDESLCLRVPARRRPSYLRESRSGFDFASLKLEVNEWLRRSTVPTNYAELVSRPSCFNRSRPTVLAYGKAHKTKGTYALLAGVERAVASGIEMNLVLACTGPNGDLAYLADALKELPHARSRLTLLPPINPWRIPTLIQSAQMACVLEHDFDVPLHNPRTVDEILMSGTVLLVSTDIANARNSDGTLIDGRTALVVDPRANRSLDNALQNGLTSPETTDIGQRARAMVGALDRSLPEGDAFASAIDAWITDANRTY